MKIQFKALIIAISFLFTSCTPPGHCSHGVCVDLSLDEPIQINQAVPVNVTIQTDQAQSQMPVKLAMLAGSDDFGQAEWLIDTHANIPVLLSTTVIFREEGNHLVFAIVLPNNLGHTISDNVVVHLPEEGGTIIPPGGTPTVPVGETYLDPLSPTLKEETLAPFQVSRSTQVFCITKNSRKRQGTVCEK